MDRYVDGLKEGGRVKGVRLHLEIVGGLGWGREFTTDKVSALIVGTVVSVG